VEVGFEPGNVVFVRVTEQKPIDEHAALFISGQPSTQIGHDIRCIIVLVIGGLAHVQIDEELLVVVKRNQRHIAVADGEECD